MSKPVFISYRRKEPHLAALIACKLEQRFGDNVFLDRSENPPGKEFKSRIARAMGSAKVVLVIMGPDWTLDVSEKVDYVEMELITAQTLQVPIIPVFAGHNRPPKLSPKFANLLDNTPVEFRPTHVESDTKTLVEAMSGYVPELLTGPGDVSSASSSAIDDSGQAGVVLRRVIAAIGFIAALAAAFTVGRSSVADKHTMGSSETTSRQRAMFSPGSGLAVSNPHHTCCYLTNESVECKPPNGIPSGTSQPSPPACVTSQNTLSGDADDSTVTYHVSGNELLTGPFSVKASVTDCSGAGNTCVIGLGPASWFDWHHRPLHPAQDCTHSEKTSNTTGFFVFKKKNRLYSFAGSELGDYEGLEFTASESQSQEVRLSRNQQGEVFCGPAGKEKKLGTYTGGLRTFVQVRGTGKVTVDQIELTL